MPRDDAISEEERRANSATDLIRMRLERLQQNIDKPAPIPKKKESLRAPKEPLEFVRNVVGSSAAAGSAEFHIYRNNRRKEQNRLDYIDAVAKREEMDTAFKQNVESVQKLEESKTAKKRAKRQRLKAAKRAKKLKKKEEDDDDDDDDSDEEDSDSDEEGSEKAESEKDDEKEEEKDEEKGNESSTEHQKNSAGPVKVE